MLSPATVCKSSRRISVCPIILHLVYEREEQSVRVLVLVYVIVCECDGCVMHRRIVSDNVVVFLSH